jgi:hypothetical protein
VIVPLLPAAGVAALGINRRPAAHLRTGQGHSVQPEAARGGIRVGDVLPAVVSVVQREGRGVLDREVPSGNELDYGMAVRQCATAGGRSTVK